MAALTSNLDLTHKLIFNANGLFIPHKTMPGGHVKFTSVLVMVFLGAILDCAPPDGYQYVISLIQDTGGDPEALQWLASFWFHWFIIPSV